MRRRLVIASAIIGILFIFITIGLLSGPLLTGKRRQSVSAWISAPGQASALASIKTHNRQLSSVSPMWYVMDEQGRLRRDWAGDPLVTKAATDKGILLIPTISNQFDPTGTAEMLADFGRRRRFIGKIVELVKTKGYDGIDLDFENMRAEDRGRFTAFVADLKSRLTPLRVLLTLDVHAKTSEPGGWQGPISHDYAGLARYADQIRMMAYDEHYAGGPPGPVASIKWVRRVLKFARKKVPGDKLVLGVPLYGYDWGESTHTHSVDYKTATAEARRFNAPIQWDKSAAAPWFTYELEGKHHTVWFENARSVAAKLDIPEAKAIRGFSFFRLGIEDQRVWRQIERRIYVVY